MYVLETMVSPRNDTVLGNDDLLLIDQIKAFDNVHGRAGINQQILFAYASIMRDVGQMEPVTVFYDGTNYWLSDGFHRFYAAKFLDKDQICCKILSGTQSDAVLHAISANINREFKRDKADKRKVVETILSNPDWKCWSDREIARRCGVSNTFVGKVRDQMLAKSTRYGKQTRIASRSGQQYPMNISNIGHSSD